MCGFIAQLVEHRTGIAEVMGSNPVEALIFFFQASSFQLLKLENLLRLSHFTFIYNRSTNMNYFIYISQMACIVSGCLYNLRSHCTTVKILFPNYATHRSDALFISHLHGLFFAIKLRLRRTLARNAILYFPDPFYMGGMLRFWRTRTHCCGHLVVAHDVSWAAQTGKHLLRTQNVSEPNQKHFIYPRHKICVRNKCCALRQTGKHLCRPQCVRNNVSSFARAFIWLGIVLTLRVRESFCFMGLEPFVDPCQIDNNCSLL